MPVILQTLEEHNRGDFKHKKLRAPRGNGRRGGRGSRSKGHQQQPESEDETNSKQIKSEFMNTVLSWNRKLISNASLVFPNETSVKQHTLPDVFTSAEQYFGSFSQLLYEEVRAQAHQRIDKNGFTFHCTVSKVMSHKEEHHSCFVFRVMVPITEFNDDPVRTHDLFVLKHSTDRSGLEFYCIAMFAKTNRFNLRKVEAKCFCSTDAHRNFLLSKHSVNDWSVMSLTNTTTAMRMYQVVITGLQPPFMRQVLSGVRVPLKKKNVKPLSSAQNEYLKSHFNPSQQHAIRQCVLNEGISIIQGPPGTGKTQTILGLLSILQGRKERVLVCSSQNVAIHQLAMRVLNEGLDLDGTFFVPVMTLVGVEEKIDLNSRLAEIYPSTAQDLCLQKCHSYQQMASKIIQLMRNVTNQITKEDLLQLDKFIKELPDSLLLPDCQLNWMYQKYIKSTLEHFLTNTKALEDITHTGNMDEKEANEYHQTMILMFQTIEQNLIEMMHILRKHQQEYATMNAKRFEETMLNEAEVTFCTLASGGRKIMKTVPAFTTIIVDECAQALECEVLIPVCDETHRLILVGDPQQLPSTVISPLAQEMNFNVSMMERLMKNGKTEHYLLDTQYRMHPMISSWPNRMFYEGHLKDSPKNTHEEYLRSWHKYAHLGPISFINVLGTEQMEHQSHYNAEEVTAVLPIVNQLLKNGVTNARKIAIITFYRKQVEKLCDAVQQLHPQWSELMKISTVDSFQGSEQDVVIVSCVRANASGFVGFLQDMRRVNVAFTRAKFSLIIIGNSETLKKDQKFALLLEELQQLDRVFEHSKLNHSRPAMKASQFAANKAVTMVRQPQTAHHGKIGTVTPQIAAISAKQQKYEQSFNKVQQVTKVEKPISAQGKQWQQRQSPALSVVHTKPQSIQCKQQVSPSAQQPPQQQQNSESREEKAVKEQLTSEFSSITNVPQQVAVHWLQKANWSLENALTSYFDVPQ